MSCPICNKPFPQEVMEDHVQVCLTMMELDGEDGDFGGYPAPAAPPASAHGGMQHAGPAPAGSGLEPRPTGAAMAEGGAGGEAGPEMGACPICADMIPSDKLQAHVTVCLDGEPVPEEERKYECGLCKKERKLDALYLLDECSHKFCRDCITKYTMKQVYQTVTSKCPNEGCSAALSARDLQLLLPNKQKITDINPKKRLMSELKYLQTTGTESMGFSVEPMDNNLFKWEIKLFGFRPEDPEEAHLAQDLTRRRVDHIVMNAVFPADYPRSPPFLRVIRPKFQFMTGHVTRGGSICTEMLTNQGWAPTTTMESVIVYTRTNLITGGARLDLGDKNDYGEEEAREAFKRMLQVHGWK